MMYESNSEERFLIRIAWQISYLVMTIGFAILIWAVTDNSYGRYFYYRREHDNDYLALSVIHSFISGYFFGLLGFIYLMTLWATQIIFLHVKLDGWTLSPPGYFIDEKIILISFVFWLFGCVPYYGIKWARREKANQ